MKPYLSVCSLYRDDAPYLREWIEFHRLVGVERFFLYNNESADEHRGVLAPYVEEGIVVVHDWPVPFMSSAGGPGLAIVRGFDHCLTEHGDDARWIAFIDVDEFLFSPTFRPISELLADYEAWPGVGVSRLDFGTSGHRTRPPGLVIENYVRRRHYPPDAEGALKTIVDPARTIRCLGPHHFLLEDGHAVDEHKRTIDGSRGNVGEVSFSRLRINHYQTRSQAELEEKLSLWQEVGWMRVGFKFNVRAGTFDTEEDDVITHYVPALEGALE